MKTIAIFAAAALLAMAVLSGTASAGERVSVATDKTLYPIGGAVSITLTNEYKDPVLLDGFTVMDQSGQTIFESPVAMFPEFLAPGETAQYLWRQIDASGCQVPEGSYTVSANGASAGIEVLRPVDVSVPADSFEYGEDVSITLTNQVEEAVYTLGGYQVLDSEGQVVYAERIAMFALPLLPGESIQYVWGQTFDTGEQVPEGVYYICSSGETLTITIGQTASGIADDGAHDGGRDVPTDLLPGKKPVPRNRMGPFL